MSHSRSTFLYRFDLLNFFRIPDLPRANHLYLSSVSSILIMNNICYDTDDHVHVCSHVLLVFRRSRRPTLHTSRVHLSWHYNNPMLPYSHCPVRHDTLDDLSPKDCLPRALRFGALASSSSATDDILAPNVCHSTCLKKEKKAKGQ